ncbi:hypothetical protein PT974_10748 [Cladobotryum mycophilum]|uniref:Uncharacterized protein n=1 Tax=Cladobotryum mycophilum TaxID=491253 RepID=A0ABR0SAQ3_9HYPO
MDPGGGSAGPQNQASSKGFQGPHMGWISDGGSLRNERIKTGTTRTSRPRQQDGGGGSARRSVRYSGPSSQSDETQHWDAEPNANIVP